MDSFLAGVGALIILWVIIIGLFVWFYVMLLLTVGEAAEIRGRSKSLWIWIAIFFTPVISFIALICAGETEEKRRNRIIEEEELKQEIKRKYAKADSESTSNTTVKTESKPTFNVARKTINDLYSKDLKTT